jgi:hypothetical protein
VDGAADSPPDGDALGLEVHAARIIASTTRPAKYLRNFSIQSSSRLIPG